VVPCGIQPESQVAFPLLADFEPKGAVSRLYGVYREWDGISQRALFVIDADGVIRWSYVSSIGVNPVPKASCSRSRNYNASWRPNEI